MVSAWEFVNAITMIPPPCILFAHANGWRGMLACVAIAMQVPFSVGYHMHESFKTAGGSAACRIDNNLRRMDQTMQHLAQILITLAVTQSVVYTMIVTNAHLLACLQLWDPDTSNDGKRWCGVAVGVCSYTLPMLYSASGVVLFSYAVIPMVIGCIFAFNPRFKPPWGHGLMHVCAWMHANAIGRALSEG